MDRLKLARLLERYENAKDKKIFIAENIEEILEILYSLKFKIDRLYEATQVLYDRKSRIVRVYMPVRRNGWLGYFSKHISKHIEIEDDRIEIVIKLMKNVVELLKDCRKLKKGDVDCSEFLKAFHKYV